MIGKKEDKFSVANNVVTDLNQPSSPLEEFAKKVFDKLLEENVPPIPYYYKVYFYNLVNESSDFWQIISIFC